MDFYKNLIEEITILLDEGESAFENIVHGRKMDSSWQGTLKLIQSIKGSSIFVDNQCLENHCHNFENFCYSIKDINETTNEEREFLVSYLYKFKECAVNLLNQLPIDEFEYFENLSDLIHNRKNEKKLPKCTKLDLIVVDDDPMMLVLLDRFLSKTNLNYKTYGSPFEALDDIKMDDLPSIVVTDIQMPDMDGIEFSKKFKNEVTDIPFVFITALKETKAFTDLVNEGAFAVIQKPLDRHKFLYTIKQAVKFSLQKQMADKCLSYILSNFAEFSEFCNTIDNRLVREDIKSGLEHIVELRKKAIDKCA